MVQYNKYNKMRGKLSDGIIEEIKRLRVIENYSIKKIAKILNIGVATSSYYCSTFPENEEIKKRNADISGNKSLSNELSYSGLLNKNLRISAKSFLLHIAGNRCYICGYDKCKSALTFHHINPKDKLFGISGSKLTHNKNKLIDEVKKCVLLCSNCHAEVHDGLIDNNILKPIKIDEKNVPKKFIEWFFGTKYGGRTFIKLECPNCKIIFDREKRNSHLVKKHKMSFCKSNCSSEYYRNGGNIVVQKIIEEFTKY